MHKIILLVLGLLLLAAGVYYYLFYPPAIYKREAQRVLDVLGAAVERQNTADVKRALAMVLSDDARIDLEVRLPTAAAPQASAMKESFLKPDFIGFIDTTLYSLSDYRFKATARSLTMNADRTAGSLLFTAASDARDIAGSLASSAHISGESQCLAELKYASGTQPVIRHLACVTTLQYSLAGAGGKR